MATPSITSAAAASDQPPPPFFIQTFSEQIERAYLRYRARSTLQKQYRQLLAGVDPDSLPALGRKRVRRGEPEVNEGKAAEDAATTTGNNSSSSMNKDKEKEAANNTASTSTTATTTKENSPSNANPSDGLAGPSKDHPERRIPHIDDTYRLDLSVAKPDPGILAVGDPPNDIYLPAILSAALPLEHRQVIQTLLDKTWESDTLFYDLDGLTHEQIRTLAEVEWGRELPAPSPSANAAISNATTAITGDSTTSTAGGGGAVSHKRKLATAMTEDERDLDEEIEHIKRAFCDKNRASALAARALEGW